MLLAVDMSLTLGGAWGAPNAPRPYTAVVRLPEGEQNYDRALVGARSWVAMMCRAEKVKIFLIEAAMRKVNWQHSAYAAFLLTSLQAVAREAAATCGAQVHAIDVHTWRKHFIGSGNLKGDESKRLAMQRCRQLGYGFADHNAAEAAGLWDFGVHTFCRRSSLFREVA